MTKQAASESTPVSSRGCHEALAPISYQPFKESIPEGWRQDSSLVYLDCSSQRTRSLNSDQRWKRSSALAIQRLFQPSSCRNVFRLPSEEMRGKSRPGSGPLLANIDFFGFDGSRSSQKSPGLDDSGDGMTPWMLSYDSPHHHCRRSLGVPPWCSPFMRTSSEGENIVSAREFCSYHEG